MGLVWSLYSQRPKAVAVRQLLLVTGTSGTQASGKQHKDTRTGIRKDDQRQSAPPADCPHPDKQAAGQYKATARHDMALTARALQLFEESVEYLGHFPKEQDPVRRRRVKLQARLLVVRKLRHELEQRRGQLGRVRPGLQAPEAVWREASRFTRHQALRRCGREPSRCTRHQLAVRMWQHRRMWSYPAATYQVGCATDQCHNT